MERRFGVDPAAVNAMLELGREDIYARVIRRMGQLPAQMQAVAVAVPLNVAAMALGMALWKHRMLAGEWRTFRLQRLAALCAILSIPPLLMLAWWVSAAGFPGALAGSAALVVSAPFDALLGLAYAALAMAFFGSGGELTERLAAVGRLSLTNYLMTSIMLALLFAGWGIGLFGQVSRAEALGLGAVPIVAMIAWSKPWLSRLGAGPFERLWRAGANALS